MALYSKMDAMNYTKPSDLKILFLGTPHIAAVVLENILQAGYVVSALICQEDKPQGRKGVLTSCEAKECALRHNVPVYSPHRIRKEHEFLKNLDYNLILCIAYGQIIPDDILKSAPLGSYNLHGSLLPKYRGAAPMQRAIMNGEKETGVCLMEMVSEMDAGDVFDKKSFPIEESDNYSSVEKKMGEAASELIVKNLLPLANGELHREKQNPAFVTIAKKILPEDEHLPLSLSLKETHDYISALSKKPGAYVYLEGKKLKILSSERTTLSPKGEAGTLWRDKKHLYLNLKNGVLSLKTLQIEGKKATDAASFLNGHQNIEGMRVS